MLSSREGLRPAQGGGGRAWWCRWEPASWGHVQLHRRCVLGGSRRSFAASSIRTWLDVGGPHNLRLGAAFGVVLIDRLGTWTKHHQVFKHGTPMCVMAL